MAGTGRISRGAWQRSSRHLGLRQQLGTSLAGAVGTGALGWIFEQQMVIYKNGRMLWDIMGPRFEIGWIYRDIWVVFIVHATVFAVSPAFLLRYCCELD